MSMPRSELCARIVHGKTVKCGHEKTSHHSETFKLPDGKVITKYYDCLCAFCPCTGGFVPEKDA